MCLATRSGLRNPEAPHPHSVRTQRSQGSLRQNETGPRCHRQNRARVMAKQPALGLTQGEPATKSLRDKHGQPHAGTPSAQVGPAPAQSGPSPFRHRHPAARTDKSRSAQNSPGNARPPDLAESTGPTAKHALHQASDVVSVLSSIASSGETRRAQRKRPSNS